MTKKDEETVDPAPDSESSVSGASCQVIYAQPPKMPEDDEIDFLELCLGVWRGRKIVVAVTLMVSVLAAGISFLLPTTYRAEVLLAPAQQDDNRGGLSAAIGGLGGLASLVGVSVGGKDTDEAIAVLKSREFLWRFVKQHELMPILFAEDWDPVRKGWRQASPGEQPGLWDAYRLLVDEGVLKVVTEKDSSLVQLLIEWRDPDLAAKWANLLVTELNAFMRQREVERTRKNLSYLEQELDRAIVTEQRQALFELISQQQHKAMLANTQEEFVFRWIDKATPPDHKFKPKILLIVAAASLAACFFVTIFVSFQDGIRKRREKGLGKQSMKQEVH